MPVTLLTHLPTIYSIPIKFLKAYPWIDLGREPGEPISHLHLHFVNGHYLREGTKV